MFWLIFTSHENLPTCLDKTTLFYEKIYITCKAMFNFLNYALIWPANNKISKRGAIIYNMSITHQYTD